MRKVNKSGLDLIRKFEGCKLAAYLDGANIPTIGYGHTTGVKLGQTISQEQAETFLGQDLITAETAVASLVKVTISDNAFSALVSFAFNLGTGSLRDSTLLKYLNEDRVLSAAQEFPKWSKVAGTVSKGLLKRRAAELELFLT